MGAVKQTVDSDTALWRIVAASRIMDENMLREEAPHSMSKKQFGALYLAFAILKLDASETLLT